MGMMGQVLIPRTKDPTDPIEHHMGEVEMLI